MNTGDKKLCAFWPIKAGQLLVVADTSRTNLDQQYTWVRPIVFPGDEAIAVATTNATVNQLVGYELMGKSAERSA
jgi:hypothetical protein